MAAIAWKTLLRTCAIPAPTQAAVARTKEATIRTGWAFVYFLLNYEENDRRVYGQAVTSDGRIPEDYKAVRKAGKLVYREAYDKYLKHFSERGSGGDRFYPMEVAKEYFIEDIGDPDVQDWDALEATLAQILHVALSRRASRP